MKLHPLTKHLDSSKIKHWRDLYKLVIAICSFGVLNIWAFPHTIAMRNIFLSVGSILGLALLISLGKKLLQSRFFSMYLLLALIAWMWVHYFAFPIAPEVAIKELKSTWLRVFLAIILGSAFGLYITQSRILQNIALLSFSSLLLIYLFKYLFYSYSYGGLYNDGYFNGMFISKAGGTYFLLWPFFISCAYIDYLTHQPFIFKEKFADRSYIFLMPTVFFGCFAAFYTLRSLNGLLIASISTLVLITRISYSSFSKGRYIKLGVIFLSIFAIFFTLHNYSKRDGGKLYNIWSDVQIAAQIDLHPNWRFYPDLPLVPKAPDGHPINASTYYRVANAIQGVRIIQAHPLGAGFTYLPYGLYLSELYPGSTADHTHSGWVDFTLGVGIPGLALFLSAIALALLNAHQIISSKKYFNPHQILWVYCSIWAIGGITMAWIFLEVSEKEYIEHLIFMVCLFAAGTGTPILLSHKEKD
ncbi:O-antigen ligase family protein [Polynucleobacter sp. JS-JIR-5-A7]|uniref:O-antigen ligase family protein n=1 Tax=Polynucleobacter sp. JS-JIR-5-A7 TaxID=1758395 RepID=UPI001BFD1E7A|nr:O-antigen ligase family protein [Polynucleobacter sp. JS-JIR-5-A7]QWE06925.1 O-antigen ligase family protein [Polynucleobacter sp. JS-JIR-5-A7]